MLQTSLSSKVCCLSENSKNSQGKAVTSIGSESSYALVLSLSREKHLLDNSPSLCCLWLAGCGLEEEGPALLLLTSTSRLCCCSGGSLARRAAAAGSRLSGFVIFRGYLSSQNHWHQTLGHKEHSRSWGIQESVNGAECWSIAWEETGHSLV